MILSLDSDFLASGPGHLRYMKQFYQRRKLDERAGCRAAERRDEPAVRGRADADGDRFERGPSLAVARFGDRSDLRARWRRSWAGGRRNTAAPAGSEKWLDGVAKDLQSHRGSSLVVAGEQQSAEVHALAHAINAALGNVGNSLYYTEPVEANPVNHLESLRELCADMDAGKVETLLILGGNPVYDAPHDFDFTSKLKKVRNTVQLSPYFDETSEHCQWHVAESHYLETWGDARAFDGTVSVIQPLIAPLYYDAFRARRAGGVQRQAGRQRLRRGARSVEGRESGRATSRNSGARR